MEMNCANCSKLKKDSIYPNVQHLMKINKTIIPFTLVGYVAVQFYPWFKFFFPCFKLIIIHYNTHIQKTRKFEPRIKLNHNRYEIGYG